MMTCSSIRKTLLKMYTPKARLYCHTIPFANVIKRYTLDGDNSPSDSFRKDFHLYPSCSALNYNVSVRHYSTCANTMQGLWLIMYLELGNVGRGLCLHCCPEPRCKDHVTASILFTLESVTDHAWWNKSMQNSTRCCSKSIVFSVNSTIQCRVQRASDDQQEQA